MGTVAQYLIFPVVWILSKIFFIGVEFHGEDNFARVVGGPAILIANHIGTYDSFLLRLSIYWKHMKVYFMGVTKFNSWHLRFLWSIGIIRLIYYFFGVFTVTPKLGLEKNLETAKRIISRQHSVFMFPEGSINKTGKLLPFKKGAAALAIATHVPVVPIGFRKVRQPHGTKVFVSIGSPIIFPSNANIDDATKELENVIASLIY